MSVVAVKKEKDKILFCADTQTTYGYHKYTPEARADKNHSKVLQDNDLTIGIVGSCSGASFMQLFIRNHKPLNATTDAILDFIMEFYKYCDTLDDTYRPDANAFLLSFKGKVFLIDEGTYVQPVEEYFAIGSGMFVALGALYSGASIKKAIEAACAFDLFCSNPDKVIEIPISPENK